MTKPAIPYVDDRPVRFVLVDTVEETAELPRQVVLADRPTGARTTLAVVLGLAVALCVIGSFGADAVRERVDAWGGGAALASVVVGLVLCVVNWRRGSWLLYPVALVIGLPALLVLGAPTVGVVAAVVVLGGGAVAARLGDRARDRRWARLSHLLTSSRREIAHVTALHSESVPNAARVRYTVSVEAPSLPGHGWAFTELSSARFDPRVGDPVTVWYDPSDPAVAVVVAASAQVGRARPPQS
ncbi:DUF3592 domain-containing protein [Cellulomonas fimi]|uniref:DUF3592 domain-containing protein n=1 Tax=Cellulomonas fimi TaxID=1708 RepID=UPI0012FC9074|nr:DUF3592 domain-containing protein [Cellulomonas fimi]NNH06103.1 DUF3592 domain-containing protein [Cellulomonas fimi]